MIAGVTPRTTVAVFAGSFAFRRTLPPFLSSRKGAAATRTPGTSNSTLNPTTRRPALGRRSRQVTMAASSSSSGLLAVHVSVKVKEGMEDDFIAASLANATNSVQEPGVSRFDLIREVGEPKNFTLVEVYNKDDAPAAHKETAHYAAWRDAVADMMAEPRTNVKYETILPANEDGWAVPSALSSGQKEAGEAKDLIDVHVFVSVKPDCVEAFKVGCSPPPARPRDPTPTDPALCPRRPRPSRTPPTPSTSRESPASIFCRRRTTQPSSLSSR